MASKINSFGSKIDFLGPPLSFEDKGSKNFQSCFGALYSIILVSAITVISFLFGQEIYQRKLPITSISQEVVANSTVMLNDFPLLFIFGNILAQEVDPHTVLEWDVVQETVSSNGVIILTVHPVNLYNCTVNNITENLRPWAPSFVYETVYCFNYSSLYAENYYVNLNSANINFRFRVCTPSLKNPKCLPYASQIIPLLTINMIYFDSYIDANNYTTPVQYAVKEFDIQIDNFFLRRNYVNVINNVLNSDDGWLLNDVTEYNFISFLDNYILYTVAAEVTTAPLDRLWITLSSPTQRTKTTRSYLKVQDLLAKIGGVAKFLLIAVQILTTDHLRFSYLKYIKKLASDEIKRQTKPYENANEFEMKNVMINRDLNASIEPLNVNDIKEINASSDPINVNKGQNKSDKELHNVKVEKLNSNNKILKTIAENQVGDTKINNYILHHATIKEFNSFESQDLSYFEYWRAYLCCEKDKNNRYSRMMNSISKLVDIQLLSKLMISVYKTDEV